MFYLEFVQSDGGEENSHCQLHNTYTGVKETLAQTEWIRFVVTQLTD
ncbi:hypothetical protein [Dethiobacter alkaliphilus]|uniref:Uncharacterized protein n=1 Tax=Dethiobacter alkaliphilus AHT 1 TaxID=555088 RepID=C0GHW1_DETAL|nr:hypothetical protein [Dethiobacter alkaliphilus]EEG77035.1 hypothetical protein DealDRAFT_2070 [Dethiobacter alkaliphilus AHT 1]MCW3489553.1 hypothetical protein [Dethiobacter alkaliphilus]